MKTDRPPIFRFLGLFCALLAASLALAAFSPGPAADAVTHDTQRGAASEQDAAGNPGRQPPAATLP